MLKKACLVCKIACMLVIIGAINWGLIGVANKNMVEQIFGSATSVTKIIYILVGLSGVALLARCFGACPACKKA